MPRAKTTSRLRLPKPPRSGPDAIELLKADHRQVEGWFEQFQNTPVDDRKSELAGKICAALRVHTQIEEEIFYPSFYAATEEEDLHNQAQVEHDDAKYLIEKIEGSAPSDELFDAQIKILAEMIRHHVNEEEKRGGMFAKARSSDMDLDGLGGQIRARKASLGDGQATGASQQTPAQLGSR